ncbi:MAG: hypothetical protein DRI81_09760 [Chloroflexi bacterium]|nr:MAG: hypothetical protein DRI81_09760 [Chloroflexota bacterium]
MDHLEIISPVGKVEFHALDPLKGVANSGRHPDNDVVLDGPGVALFHAVLDYTQQPARLVILGRAEKTALAGRPLSPDLPTELRAWDTLEIGGYTLIPIGGAGAEGGPLPAEQPTETVAGKTSAARGKGWLGKLGQGMRAPLGKKLAAPKIPVGKLGRAVATRRGAGESPAAPGTVQAGSDKGAQGWGAGRPVAPPPDALDEVIVTELGEREWTVDVEQTAIAELTIVNGGDIVAAFEVRVEGLDGSWVAILPPRVNLNEGERASVTISITPPRRPASRAGGHPFSVVVTSSNYPGRSSRRGAALTVNPYYEFRVGELTPKRQTVSWRRQSGQVIVPIVNRGNSVALFRVEAEDDERACGFEIIAPGEEAGFARQAEMRLPPEHPFNIPIYITPHARKLWSLSQRFYSYAVTVSLLEDKQSPRALMGQLRSKPLIGPWLTALILLLLVVATVLTFRPRINDFGVEPEIVSTGESVRLTWNVSPFVTNLEIEGVGPVKGSGGTKTDSPDASCTYVLKADTWLSRLLPQLSEQAQETVIVMPRTPGIETFSVDDTDITQGESVTLYWSVSDAGKVILTANGISQVIPPEEHIGQRTVSPGENTVYALEAQSGSGMALKSVMVKVAPSVLEVQAFDVQPPQVMAGESVTITWQVAGADAVTISPLPTVYPSSGSTTYAPEQTMDFVLTASNAESETRVVRSVVVNPAPEAPTIEFFAATPNQVTGGSSSQVQLTWSVVGATTNIEVTGPDFETRSGLAAQDAITVQVDKSTTFILTAYNGDLHTSQVVEITALEPTPESE